MSAGKRPPGKTSAPTRDVQRDPERDRERQSERERPSQATLVGPRSLSRSPLLDLQRSAGNHAVASLLSHQRPIGRLHDAEAEDASDRDPDQERADERDADHVADRLVSVWARNGSDFSPGAVPSGAPIPDALKAGAEQVLGIDLGDVRLRDDDSAHQATDQLGANAATVGREILFSRDRLDVGSRDGQTLLGHELAHVAQQATTGVAQVQRQPKAGSPASKPKPTPRKVVRATIYLDLDIAVFELEGDVTRTVRCSSDPKPAPGNYTDRLIRGVWHLIPDEDTHNGVDGVLSYMIPPSISFAGVTSYRVRILAGKPGVREGGTGAGSDVDGIPNAAQEHTVAASPPNNKDASTEKKPLTAAEQKAWRELVDKMTGATTPDATDPKEMLRLFQVLRERVEDPQFSTKSGEPWTKFARFLDLNRDKIEGIMKGKPAGALTQEKIEKIIAEFGKFVASTTEAEDRKGKDDQNEEGTDAKEEKEERDATEPTSERTADEGSALKTVDDFDKEFKDDPNWRKLSKEDKALLVEMAKLDPEGASKEPIDFTKVTTTMKVMMALKLSWKSWPGETGAAAKAAFSDPGFIITLIVMMGIYVGLWLTPEPSGVTKVAAGALTAALLIQFALEDIVGFAMAWMDLSDACAAATTVPALQAAGDRFAKKVGQVGFDIILMIVMHRLGKAVGPKVQKIGIDRSIKSASAAVETAQAKPGSGVDVKAKPENAKLLDSAKTKAKGTTPTAVLDSLADQLPAGSRKGLRALRDKAGDMGAYKSMESKTSKGLDIPSYLEEVAMSPDAIEAAKLDLLNAEAKLARAKLVEAETLKDPKLRDAARADLAAKLKARLADLGLFEDPAVKKAAASKDPKDLVGALAEAIQRTQLKAEHANVPKARVLSNMAVGRKVPGFTSIAEWKAAQVKAGLPSETIKLVEFNGEVFELQGEADAIVVQETAPNKFKPLTVEEVKGGAADQPTRAMGQANKMVQSLGQVATGSGEVRAFELNHQHKVTADWTASLDLSAVDKTATSTRGPQGKGFAKNLPYDAEVLLEVAKSILKDGLPPKNPPPTLPPLPRPKEQKKEPQPTGQ